MNFSGIMIYPRFNIRNILFRITMILSILVDTFFSKILLTMPPRLKLHNIVFVLA